MTKLRIIYAGTPEFALPCLKKIYDSGHDLLAVLTQPDRPAGRGLKLQQSAVKQFATEKKLTCYQPVKIELDFIKRIKELKPDILVVAAYGIILPVEFINIFPQKAFNIHGSILPKWRGAAPIQRAILNGDKEIGVSIMEVVEKLDAGNVYAIKKELRNIKLTSKDYFEILADDGAELMLRHLHLIANNTKLVSEKQNDLEVTYAKKIFKEEALVTFEENSDQLINKILAFNPFPIVRASFRGKDCKIYHAEKSNIGKMSTPGQVLIINDEVYLGTMDTFIKINEIQMVGGKILTGSEFIKSYQVKPTDIFTHAT